jgi:DNA-binding CsgD family transcriptional regulator
LLYDVYGFSRRFGLDEFQRQVLERLRREIDFASAWWGIGSGHRELRSSYAFQLPATFDAEWERVKYEDTIWDRANLQSGRSINVDVTPAQLAPGICEFSWRFGIHHVLAINAAAAHPRGTFLSLYRGPEQPPFSAAECRLLELLIAHLVAAWSASWEAQLQADSRLAHGGESAWGVFDSCGSLLAAHREFLDLLRLEWPQCPDGALPAPARTLVAAGGSQGGRQISLCSSAVRGLRLVEVRRRSRLEALTPRERVIAVLYGQGSSYRDIAAELDIAANTVRHHLRAIFLKLSISDKTELAQLVGADPGPAGRS